MDVVVEEQVSFDDFFLLNLIFLTAVNLCDIRQNLITNGKNREIYFYSEIKYLRICKIKRKRKSIFTFRMLFLQNYSEQSYASRR